MLSFDKLNEAELKEFLDLNSVSTAGKSQQQLAQLASVISQKSDVKITIPVLALHRATMVSHIPGYYQTTAYEFLERDANKDLSLQAKALSIDPSAPYLRPFIFRVLELQGKLKTQTSDEIQQARLFDYVTRTIEHNDLTEMYRLFEQGLDANLKHQKGVSLLWYTTVGIPGKPYRIDMIRLLLEKGADVNFIAHESSILKNVCYCKPTETDRMKLIQELFDKYGVKKDTTEKENSLFAAIITENLPLVEYLLQKGLSPNVSDNYRTIFEVDIYNYDFNLQLYPVLLKYGADKTLPNSAGESIIYVLANTYNQYFHQNNAAVATRLYKLYSILN